MEIFALPLHRCEKLAPGKQGLDTTSPQGKLMFQVLGSFAEFSASLIQERVNAGMARAKAQGKHVGRPRLNPELAQAIRDAPALPCRPGIRVIGKQFGVSPMTVLAATLVGLRSFQTDFRATRLSDDLQCCRQPPRRRLPSRGVFACRYFRFFRQVADI